MTRAGNRSGMTLLELVVALAITGMAVSGGYAAFATLVDRRDAAAKSSAAILRDASARAMLVQWLAGARLTVEEDEIQFRAVDGGYRPKGNVDAVPDDDLVFFTTAHDANGTVVHLYIDRDERTPERGLVAELREWNRASPRIERVELVPNAASLDGRFLSGVFGQRQWLNSWVSTSVLPAAARLTIAAERGDSLSPLWRVPITVSIEGSR